MSSDSDSEQFYDAEDITPIHGSRKPRGSSKDGLVTNHRANSEPNVSSILKDVKVKEISAPPTQIIDINIDDVFVAPKPSQGGRKKFKELRQKLQNDDEDAQISNLTPPNSQTSSIEGVYASSKTSHPFRVIEVDTSSLQSFNSGRRLISQADLGSHLFECKKAISSSALSISSHSSSTQSSKDTTQYPSTVTLATISTDAPAHTNQVCLPLQEPDVIASTKPCLQKNNLDIKSSPKIEVPVAPPRRKKKNKSNASSLPITPSTSTIGFPSSGCIESLTSPASTIETLTRELEHSLVSLPSKIHRLEKTNSSESSKCSTIRSVHSLDITQVAKGLFVVRPLDSDKAKAANTSKETLPEEKKAECAQDDNSTSQRGSTNRSSVGHYSLGPHRSAQMKTCTKERRKSAGDENMLAYASLIETGKQLTDLEILQQVTVLNLDTGERIPLSVAEDKLPQCLNPLSLHIMRLTSEYVSSSNMEKDKESDDESIISSKKSEIHPLGEDNEVEIGLMRRKTARIKKFFGTTVRRTMDKAKSIAQEVSHARHKEDIVDVVDEVHPGDHNIKLKAANSHKGPYDFEKVHHVQELNSEHEGAIWCMKFSSCGRLLATAGQDKVLRIWVIIDAYQFFHDMRTKYNADKVSPTPSQESLVSHNSSENPFLNFDPRSEEASKYVFMPKPFCTYSGHTSDLLDVSWSKNYFILSSSMDKTVRLWHISRKECLCCFQHIDFVTAIVFHPRDDRYFLSGSLDGKIRLWNIPDKKVAVWNEIDVTTKLQNKLITAANFCQNGKFAVIGTYDGRCIFYTTEQLKYHTQIHVRSSRGRNAIGRKISGIEPMPDEDKILITSNDSRIRLYDLRDLSLTCKYKGYVNISSQIKASFSHDGKYIISGSENRDIYIWKTNHDYSKFSSVRRDRNVFWEAIKAHNVTVTCAIFAPNPDNIIKMIEDRNVTEEQEEEEEDPMVEQRVKGCGGYVLISADFNGCIKIFMNKMKPKHSSLPASALV
ncbi:PREDICTED: WD repeat-containing protein 44 [Nicrophorus vespilloides]|uniref:WD repeat-containing protein 44 n=1 Tax=Nicrophorus vespilloides TaxID=110193 RepID=A0ABM1NIY9_NICVS|nr:PREDICTED: WD repeat-containing protein 44 [Nicrophorus vespilloides]